MIGSKKDFTYLLLGLIALAFVATVFLKDLYQYQWLVLSELKETETIWDSFEIANQNYQIPGPLYYLQEKFIASPLSFKPWVFLLLGVVYVLFLSYLSAIISKAKPVYFYIGISILFWVIGISNFDALYQQSNQLVSVSHLLAFLMIQFLCRNYTQSQQFGLRFGLFFAFWGIVLGSLIFTNEPDSAIHWLINQIPAIAFFTFGILFYLAYDIYLAIIRLAEKPNENGNFKRYTIALIVVALQFVYLFMQVTGQISGNYAPLIIAILLGINFVASYWNLSLKQVQINQVTNSTFHIHQLGLVVSVILVFCYFAFTHFTVNEALVDYINDIFVYSNLTMTIPFFLYLFINFFLVDKQAYSIFPILFKPYSYSLIYFRGLGLLLFLLLASIQYFKIIDEVKIGFFVALGDFDNEKNDLQSSEIQYKQALKIEPFNHRANYSLGNLAVQNQDYATAGAFYRKAIQMQASPFAFAGLGYCLEQENQLFEQLILLKQAHQKFPKNAQICNNLALVFEKSKNLDSSLNYLQKAKNLEPSNGSILANNHAFYLEYGDSKTQKLYLEDINNQLNITYNALIANTLALKLKNNAPIAALQKNAIPIDSTTALSVANFAWLHNASLKKSIDKSDIYQSLIKNPANQNISGDVLESYILHLFLNKKPLEAMTLLQTHLANTSGSKQQYLQKLLNTFYKKSTEFSQIDALSINSVQKAESSFAQEPLNINVLQSVVDVLNKANQPRNAYDKLVQVKNFLPNSPVVSSLYIKQALKIFAKDDAVLEMEHLRQMDAAYYQKFLSVYQAQLALVEKSQQTFE